MVKTTFEEREKEKIGPKGKKWLRCDFRPFNLPLSTFLEQPI